MEVGRNQYNRDITLIVVSPDQLKVKHSFLEEVLWSIRLAYSKIPGGCFEDASSLLDSGVYWRLQLCSETQELLCCSFWKEHRFGKKLFCCGHNGTLKGKHLFNIEKVHLLSLKQDNYFLECSGVVEDSLLREGFHPLSNNIAETVLWNKSIQKDSDKIHYSREIRGTFNGSPCMIKVRKVMFGNPKL